MAGTLTGLDMAEAMTVAAPGLDRDVLRSFLIIAEAEGIAAALEAQPDT